jgi:YD repeat-containing protein
MTGRDGVEWSSTVGALHQTTSRTSVEGTETYAYDATGRLSSMVRGGSVTFYRYDGLGRLRAVENGVGLVRAFDRDADGVIVRRWGGSAPASFEVAGWSQEVGRPAKEDYTPHVSGAAGQLQFHLVEFDGTNIVSSRPLGAVVGFRRQGAYGQEFTSGGEPELRRSFHGHREEPGLALTAAGPRHLLRADGRWLQPEPLLYLGIPEELRSDPRALMMYRYGHNAPSVYADDTGFLPQVAAGGALMTAALWGYRLYTAADTVATATDYGVAAYALWRGDVSLAQDLAVTATMGAGTPVPNGLATARAAKRYGPELAASAARMGEGVGAAVSRTADEAVDLVSRGAQLDLPFGQSLPPNSGGKTQGVLQLPGEAPLPLQSGVKGPSEAVRGQGLPGFNGNQLTHVEGHAAAHMRSIGATYGTLDINKVPCSAGSGGGCDGLLPAMLPEGAQLRVRGPDGFDQTYTGLPD